MGAEVFHADGRTDITKLTVVCRNFAKARKNDEITEKKDKMSLRGKNQNSRKTCRICVIFYSTGRKLGSDLGLRGGERQPDCIHNAGSISRFFVCFQFNLPLLGNIL